MRGDEVWRRRNASGRRRRRCVDCNQGCIDIEDFIAYSRRKVEEERLAEEEAARKAAEEERQRRIDAGEEVDAGQWISNSY